jgi:hypothetical protein
MIWRLADSVPLAVGTELQRRVGALSTFAVRLRYGRRARWSFARQLGVESFIEQRSTLERRGIIWADTAQPSAEQIDARSCRLKFEFLYGIHLINYARYTIQHGIVQIESSKKCIEGAMATMVG